jgi:murein DD-endopeptidase MepM/ murein hydrolase activator NlpD
LNAALVALVAAASLALGGWGAEQDAASAKKLIDGVRPKLAAIVAAKPAERAALAEALAKSDGLAAIEALKRFRNPELVEVERALLRHDDWHVQHRALLLAEKLKDAAVVPLAWELLAHAEPRLRERAAITCLLLWERKSAAAIAGGKAKEALAARIAEESEFLVKQALLALERRMSGKLVPHAVAEEHLVKLDDGLLLVPFLDGMDQLAAVAPGVVLAPSGSPGGSSAEKLPVAAGWNGPLLLWGSEVVAGLGLQPFANPRQNGTVVHTGQDVGGCLDGAGLYACADGIVRFVHAGSDMGTLLVVEHHRAKKEVVNVVYMHGGTDVLVAVGDKVAAGQLLGTMGIGYTIENGGHFAHLHLGLYPGPFSVTHNYGYKPAAAGLEDWLDPAKALAEWIKETPSGGKR